MPVEQIGQHEIDYSGVALDVGTGWAAHLAIYAPSTNPMHQNSVFPQQRVAVETVFVSEAVAAAAAREVGMSMLASREAGRSTTPTHATTG